MLKFKHLSLEEREKLYLWHELSISFREIGRRLGRDHKAISKEIKRNTKYGRKYLPCIAQKRAKRVGAKQRYKAPLKDPRTFLYAREKLRLLWTPEIIAGRIGIDIPGSSIDKETIYRYIYSVKAKRYKLWNFLPNHRRKRMKMVGRRIRNKGKIPNAVLIDYRSKIVARRRQAGHWETDNVEGPRTSRPALSVTIERCTRYHLISLVPNQTAQVKSKDLVERLSVFPSKIRRTVTQDNGKENYAHEKTAKLLGTKMFFCHAYHSWEKGTVENRNKSIRRFFPKGTDFTNVSEKEIQAVESILNSRPMKCLGYLTPYEKTQKELSLINH